MKCRCSNDHLPILWITRKTQCYQWRPIGDSNPCCRRERAVVSELFQVVIYNYAQPTARINTPCTAIDYTVDVHLNIYVSPCTDPPDCAILHGSIRRVILRRGRHPGRYRHPCSKGVARRASSKTEPGIISSVLIGRGGFRAALCLWLWSVVVNGS